MDASDAPVHRPVLTAEILDLLQLSPGVRCIDGTIDGGGHTAAILERTAPDGVVLGIDRDPELLTAVRRRLADAVDAGRLHLASGNFRELTRIATVRHFSPVQAIVLDLGSELVPFRRQRPRLQLHAQRAARYAVRFG